jgi:hypothetical protein
MTLRRNVPIVILFFAAAILVVAAIASAQGGPPTNRRQQERQEDATRHGGWIARFHGQGAGVAAVDCDLPPGVSLQNNWTHGDYVSSWATWIESAPAAQLQEAAIGSASEAAHSGCGKPLHVLKLKPTKEKAPKTPGS